MISASGKVSALSSPVAPAHAPFNPDRPNLGETFTSASAAHYREWISSCRGGAPGVANFAFEAPIAETLMLGNIAVRTQQVLEWDAAEFRLTRGSSAAQALLKPTYREPWAAFAQAGD